jgi:hypothetical protein
MRIPKVLATIQSTNAAVTPHELQLRHPAPNTACGPPPAADHGRLTLRHPTNVITLTNMLFIACRLAISAGFVFGIGDLSWGYDYRLLV